MLHTGLNNMGAIFHPALTLLNAGRIESTGGEFQFYIDGVTPSVETVAKGEYPVSRPLYFYVKAAHIGVIPGLKEYAEFFVSDDMAGPDGPLAEYGLVSDPELAATQEMVEFAGKCLAAGACFTD